MRLIDASLLTLQNFHDDSNLPPYAILSHTWTEAEVTMERLKEAHSSDRAKRERVRKTLGYRKIVKACQQAVIDGLSWVWVDTCCIDKTSSAELSEAINSMFRYYQRARICYAYLHDVEAEDSPVIYDHDQQDPVLAADLNAGSGTVTLEPNKDTAIYVLEESLSKAKWFTRGWCLQELIAPKEVIFYAKGWKFMGKKEHMRPMLSRITGISGFALKGKPLNNDSIARRMSWMAKRSTTRVEDLAYSLLGIFDVNMPLLYGEGEKAFIRLQEEIMKNSDDHSLFAWTSKSDDPNRWAPRARTAFATHPREFANAGMIGYSPFFPGEGQPYALTNKGIQVRLCLLPTKTTVPNKMRYLALLECHYIKELPQHRPAIIIQRLSDSATQYCRLDNVGLEAVHMDEWQSAEWKDIYLCKTVPQWWYQNEMTRILRMDTTWLRPNLN